MIFPSEIME